MNPALGCHKLLTQYQCGDREAFDKLFGEKFTSLLQCVIKETRLILDEMEAEGIVQQAFLKVCVKIKTYRGQTDGEAWSWIRTIARNKWRDFLRQKKRYEQRLVSLNDEFCVRRLIMFDDHAVDRIDWLESFVATLTIRERQILELMQDGVSQTIIAAQFGLCLPRITQIKQSIKKKAQKFEKQTL